MTSRDLVIRSLNHQPVVRVPRDLWRPSQLELDEDQAERFSELQTRYPSDIIHVQYVDVGPKATKPGGSGSGRWQDAWGCVWQRSDRQLEDELLASPLDRVAKFAPYRPPGELLEKSRFSKVNRVCGSTTRFVLAHSQCRPFDRLRWVRGPQAALGDLSRGSKRFRSLMAMLHEHFCREIELWAATDVDGVMFQDDWGSEKALLIAPAVWREVFLPLYRDYCRILRAADKFVFFRSAGNIADLFRSLINIGVDAINGELFLMNIERLAKRFRGRVTFWGEIDRRRILPSGTPAEVREAVLRIRRALDFGSGGLIARCQWENHVPIENLFALFDQWLQPLPMHAN